MPGRFTRFLIVGLSSAGIYFLLSYLQISRGVRPAYAGIISYILTFGLTYYAQYKWTFGASVPYAKSLPRYFIFQLSAAATSSFFTEALAAQFSWSPVIASVVVTLISAGASFIVSNFWVFSK